MVFNDVDTKLAMNVLSEINWYHLKIYFSPFLLKNDTYQPNTSFSHGMTIYHFDAELKDIVIKASLLFEIIMRSKIDQILTNEFSFQWYLLDKIFERNPSYERQRINDSLKKTDLPFAKHYRENYTLDNPSYMHAPPSWIAMELVSFDLFLKIFNSLDTQQINNIQGFKYELNKLGIHSTKTLQNWLEVVKGVRNKACHNSKIWNSWHKDPKEIIKSTPDNIFSQNKIFNVIYIMEKVISASHLSKQNIKLDLKNLISRYENDIPHLHYHIGFPVESDKIGW